MFVQRSTRAAGGYALSKIGLQHGNDAGNDPLPQKMLHLRLPNQ
jgi:hypothetical protein